MCALTDDEEEKADNIEMTEKSNMEPTTSQQRPKKPATILSVLEKEMSVEFHPLTGNNDYQEICTSELRKNLKMINIVPNRFFPSKLCKLQETKT